MLNLDTHILLDALADKLRASERRLLEDNAWSISPIVLWEIGLLGRLNRTRVSLRTPELRRTLDRMTIWDFDRHVAEAVMELDFRSDPADEIIAATSVVHGIPLLTRDTRILASKLVPLALP